MTEKSYRWFLAPKDDRTNGIIAKQCSAEDFSSEALCADGKHHNLWECTEEIRDAIVASKRGLGLSFEVFCKENGGKIRNVSFLFRRRPKKYPVKKSTPACVGKQKATV